MQSSYSSRSSESFGDYDYAGFWVRLAAYMLDSIIVFFALLAVRLVMSGFMAAVKGTPLGGNILFQYDLRDIVLYGAEALYFILCTYYTGTTLGKRAMNLRVIHAGGEEKLGLLTVIYRETVGRFLSGVIMGIGYFMIGIDKEKRGIHDILCDTRVIYARKIKVFKIEKVFTPLAEPMGKAPVSEDIPRTYTMKEEIQEQTRQGETMQEAPGGRESGEVSSSAPKMPWDAPYIRPKEPEKHSEGAVPEPSERHSECAVPEEPEKHSEGAVPEPSEAARKDDNGTTAERDS